MWKEAPSLQKTSPSPSPLTAANPVSEDELRGILDRLEKTRDIFRENRELRSVLVRREAENQELKTRNGELDEILRKFAPMLLNMATTMGLAAKAETREVAPRTIGEV